MSENYKELVGLFKEVQQKGWVESHRKGDTGIGKTFEDLIGKKEDNEAAPDFKDIEIKSQREASSSMITLFTKSPDYPRGVNTYLREQFGNQSPEYGGKKILHTTISATRFNTHVGGYGFRIVVDREMQRLVLEVKDLQHNITIYNKAYWSFAKIEHALNNKLKYVALVEAEEKSENNKNYFKFVNMNLMTGLTLDKFLEALEVGDILVDIRIGVYNSGKKEGKTHDHGTGFRIKLSNLMKYATIR